MFLSKLVLNLMHHHVRADLGSPYEMHRTLMRAFPGQKEGGPGRVLFRVDQVVDDYGNPQPVVLVQSDKPPAWSQLSDVRELVDYALSIEHKKVNLAITRGQHLTFRLRANPTVKQEGKRHGLFREDEQERWLARKAENGGFKVLACRTTPESKIACLLKANGSPRKMATMFAVRYEGVLEVSDPAMFQRTLETGIGSGKGFGFGMLSIARTSQE